MSPIRQRAEGREAAEMRAVRIVPNVNPYAEGSVEVSFGNTRILVAASVENEAPRWIEDGAGGWITAEYGMLPRSTHTRMRREAAEGKQGGRTLEIQRIIGRALRQAVDLVEIPDLTVRLDCDVLCADGGTRTASISGAWVALAQALSHCHQSGLLKQAPRIRQVAAVSVGASDAQLLLDLDYEEDSSTDFDLNLVFNDSLEIIEIQGTGERKAISSEVLLKLLELGREGAKVIFKEQRRALDECLG